MDPREALARLVEAATSGELDELCERHGVRLLGAFGSATRSIGPAHRGAPADPGAPGVPHSPATPTMPRDLDIAVSFGVGIDERRRDILGLLDDLVVLTGCDVLDIAVLDGADPVLRAEALVGVPLFEDRAGAYTEAQMSAIAERYDTQWLRDLDLQSMTPMTPMTP